jgi:hypothetical protein
MRISISENSNVTKTFKYLFGIELSIYNTVAVEEAFENLYPSYHTDNWEPFDVYLDDEATSDYCLKEELKSENPLFIYHIKVDTTAKDFEKNLNVIKGSSNYIDCYQCKNKDSKYAIIRYKISVKHRVLNMVDSNYSKMYNKKELNNIKINQYIKNRYTFLNNDNEQEFNEPFLVLEKSEEILHKLCKRLGITDRKTIKIMKTNEYDSKFNFQTEIINSNLL